MVTQEDVAKLAGVSFITVSRVINNQKYVKKETREKVLKAIKELKYYPNSLGRGLNNNKVNTIGIIALTSGPTSIIGTAYYNSLLVGIEDCCAKNKYDLLLSSQKDFRTEFDYLRLYRERKIDGMIFITIDLKNPQIQEICKEDIPVVVIGDRPMDEKICFIDTDNTDGIRIALDYLVAKGHSKIGFLRGEDISTNCKERFEGFLSLIKKYQLPFNENWIFDGDFTIESGKACINKLTSLSEKPTALICATDLMAIGVLQGAKDAGISIPDDLSVIGFDGIEATEYTSPGLTTIQQPLVGMGTKAVEILLEKMTSRSFLFEYKIYPVELLERDSVKQL